MVPVLSRLLPPSRLAVGCSDGGVALYTRVDSATRHGASATMGARTTYCFTTSYTYNYAGDTNWVGLSNCTILATCFWAPPTQPCTSISSCCTSAAPHTFTPRTTTPPHCHSPTPARFFTFAPPHLHVCTPPRLRAPALSCLVSTCCHSIGFTTVVQFRMKTGYSTCFTHAPLCH